MASLTVIIRSDSGELKNVKIQLHHKRGLAVFSTPYWVREDEFRNGIIVKRTDASLLNMRIASILEDYIRILGKIDFPETYTCSQLKRLILSGLDCEGNTMFTDYAKTYIRNLRKENRLSYADMIDRSVRYFTSYVGNMPLRAIRPEHLEDWTRYLINKKKRNTKERVSRAFVNICLSHIKAIINSAIRERKVRYDIHPFISTKITRSPIKDAAVDKETIKTIRESKPKTRHLVISRDMFMLSFYLGGMNLVDILKADFRGKEIKYRRTKTVNRTDNITNIPIIDDARVIIDRYMNKSGRLNLRYGFSDKNLRSYISKGVTMLAESLGIEKTLFISARKTFAQMGLELGIPDSIIDSALGHSSSSRGIISYYSQVKPKQIRDAIEKVVSHL